MAHLAWEHLGNVQEQLENMARQMDRGRENGWMDGWIVANREVHLY